MPERDKPANVAAVQNVPSDQSSQADRFAELSEQERVPLRLLAEGHTVKSAATLLDTTPSAINERLREARKKTGIGSSRELARQLKAQENRDTKIGIEPNGNRPASRSRTNKRPWLSRIGIFIMLIFAASLALGVYALISQVAPNKSSDTASSISFSDPLLDKGIPQFDMAAAHAKVRSEPEDAQWAPRAENILRTRFKKIPLIGGPNNPLRITCATTLCEVAGIIDAPLPKNARSAENSALNKSMQDIQGKPLLYYFKKHGLKTVGGIFGATKGKREIFFFYYQREGTK